LGKSLQHIPVEERILTGLFVCSGEPNDILQQLKPEWNEHVDLPVVKKLLIINYSLLIKDVFPWENALTGGIDHEKFCESFFVQPDLFLRLRPGYENMAKEKLLNAKINFREMNASCLSLPNNSKIENIIELDKEAVVQDYSSQQIAEYLKLAIDTGSHRKQSPIRCWDCCAASGGKSLLLYDINPGIDLTVSDIRESILINLRKRFAKAGIKKYKAFATDLTNNLPPLKLRQASQQPASAKAAAGKPATSNYDLIICDAPCTGSGTWSRTPEQLYFFDEKRIEQYASLQKKIVTNIIPHLKEKGYLVYITCSVFKKENEEIVEFIKNKFGLEMVRTELLKGYDKKADNMFSALFRKL
jgi:16S rRNA (cytosine967-C5)-methyltransferase